ncbi:MAG: hypothetical protein KDD22_06650 [Bdellovibrionales bacterium]|nr:hypothetical protein [Bdellovibrionales bacterium]
MNIQTLDWIFPFVVLGYGAMATLALSLEPYLQRQASRIPESYLRQLKGHRVMAFICLIVGGLWSLQNLWTQPLPPFLS